MAYADYTFYTDVYLGNVIPRDDFNRVAQRSSDIIDILTYDNIDADVISNANIYTKIKKANCALAEQIYYDEQTVSISGSPAATISSIKAGEETITYNKNSGNTSVDIQKDKYSTALSIISGYLSNTNLLYMGVR